MKKQAIKKIEGINKLPFFKLWVEKDKTFAEIGKLKKISSQGAKQKFDSEVDELWHDQGFKDIFTELVSNGEGGKYPFVDFSKEKHGKFFAYALKKYLGYHIIDKKYASLLKYSSPKRKDEAKALNILTARTEILKHIKSEGLPLTIPLTPKDNTFVYDSVLFLAGEPAWAKFFDVIEDKKSGEQQIVAMKGETILYNLCEWKKNNPKMTVEDIFLSFSDSFRKKNKVTSTEELVSYLSSRKNYLYMLDTVCKKTFLSFIGVGNGKRGRKKAETLK